MLPELQLGTNTSFTQTTLTNRKGSSRGWRICSPLGRRWNLRRCILFPSFPLWIVSMCNSRSCLMLRMSYYNWFALHLQMYCSVSLHPHTNSRLWIAHRIRHSIFDRRGLHLRFMKWQGKLFVMLLQQKERKKWQKAVTVNYEKSHSITKAMRQICSNFEMCMQSCFQNFMRVIDARVNYHQKKNGEKNILERTHELLIPRKKWLKISNIQKMKKKSENVHSRGMARNIFGVT